VPGGSDVCVIGHTLHAVCVSVRRKFAERHTPNAKMHYFIMRHTNKIDVHSI